MVVFGSTNAAIYDLQSGKVWWIGKKIRHLLEKLRDGLNLSKEELKLVDKIKSELGIAKIVFDEEATLQVRKERYPRDFQTINIEVTSRCNQRCIHCYAFSDFSCKDELSVNKQMDIIMDAKRLGFKTIQFIGGEPLLKKNAVLRLINYAKSLGFKWIQLYTNGTLISREIAKELSEKRVEVKVSLYGHLPEIHDRITQVKGSFEKTLKGIKLLQSYHLDVKIGVVIMRQNQEVVDEIKEFLGKIGVKNVFIDPVRPLGRAKENWEKIKFTHPKVIKYRVKHKPNFRTSYSSFLRFKYANSCLHGCISVLSSGDLTPCIESKKLTIGNIREKSFYEIMTSSAPESFWYLTKDDVEICRECEFRYTCFDCRALAVEGGLSRGNYCSYDPLLGKWSPSPILS